MSTLTVTNIISPSATTDLVLKTGNTSGPQIVVAANGAGVTLRGNSAANSVFINSTTVYINGSLPTVANLSVTGTVNITGNVTPAIITSNTSAWNPGTNNVFIINVQANSTTNSSSNTAYGPGYEPYIFGLTAGANGQIVVISNIGSQKIRLMNEDSTTESTAANRFNMPNHVWLGGFQSIKMQYDGTLARWRPMNSLLIAMDHKYSLTKGFFSGGFVPSPINNVTTADRTTYSTETTAAVAGAALSQGRQSLNSSSNADKGFFNGGISPTVVATADRTIYASETTAAVSGANLTAVKWGAGGIGNFDKGFYTGGNSGGVPGALATTDRTTYSTETTVAVAAANLSQARDSGASAGNVDKGFTNGGTTYTPAATVVTTSDKTTYASETTVAVAGTNLSQARRFFAASGNSDKGFFSGGFASPINLATSDKTTYASETTAAVVGANLSQARYGIGSAGSDTKQFSCGGTNGSGVATADKTTYSTETTAAVVGANLSQARYGLSGI